MLEIEEFDFDDINWSYVDVRPGDKPLGQELPIRNLQPCELSTIHGATEQIRLRLVMAAKQKKNQFGVFEKHDIDSLRMREVRKKKKAELPLSMRHGGRQPPAATGNVWRRGFNT